MTQSLDDYTAHMDWMVMSAHESWISREGMAWEKFVHDFAPRYQVEGNPLWDQGLLPYLNALSTDEERLHAVSDQARPETVQYAMHMWTQATGGFPEHVYDQGMDTPQHADAQHADDGMPVQHADDPSANAPRLAKFIGGVGSSVVKPPGGNVDLDQFLTDLAAFGLTYSEADFQGAVDAFRQSGATKDGTTPAVEVYGSIFQCSYWEGDGANGYQKVWTMAFVADDGVLDQRNEACVNGLREDGDVCYYTQVGPAVLLDASGFDPLFGLARYCSWLQGSGEFGTITRTNKTLGRNTLTVSSIGTLDQGAMKATLRKFTDKAVDFQ